MFFSVAGKGSLVSPHTIRQMAFPIGQVLIKILVDKSVSAIQDIGNRKDFSCSPIDQANPFAHSCRFTLKQYC